MTSFLPNLSTFVNIMNSLIKYGCMSVVSQVISCASNFKLSEPHF